MSCTLPIKSFLLCLSLTSSPINREECPLSLRRYLFVSPLHHPLGPPLSVSHLDALILYFWLFSLFCFFSISPSLSLSLSVDWKKMLCHAYFKPAGEGEEKCCWGFDTVSWQLAVRTLVEYRWTAAPYTLLSGTVGLSRPLLVICCF